MCIRDSPTTAQHNHGICALCILTGDGHLHAWQVSCLHPSVHHVLALWVYVRLPGAQHVRQCQPSLGPLMRACF
eukprot:14998192-Alexandrium_andersonii.AAC.1